MGVSRWDEGGEVDMAKTKREAPMSTRSRRATQTIHESMEIGNKRN